MFENKLQWIKRRARWCNFKNPIKSIVGRWSLSSARDLSRLQNSSRHEIEIVFASDECVASADMLTQLGELDAESDVPVGLLSALLSGGDPLELWSFAQVACVSLHDVHVIPGSFILHWSVDHEVQCLALVTCILQLRKEDEVQGEVWLDILRFPGVPHPSAKQLTVANDMWEAFVANKDAHVRVLERYDQLRFTSMRQCPVPGAHLFIKN